ncbi:MAG: type VI secretion system membrane subunit TssM, partial [Chitinivibrionales bacterium]|nr:type VI secretion system membrane subunit TssM [Chitinivibrionales bacterium]
QIFWRFANEAVWIDTPGAFIEDNGREQWQALIAALNKVRPQKPLDGIALVVSAKEILESSDAQIREKARMARSRIDELIKAWGIEFPVYLIFNRADEVPGFFDYFGDQVARAREQIFGATLSAKQQAMLSRIAFLEEYGVLAKSLNDLRLDKLFKEKSDAGRRMICRFVIHFEGIQEKLASFITELFKPSSYEGKPIFRGFYFTTCRTISPAATQELPPSAEISRTIANHPLNPKRDFFVPADAQKKEMGGAKKSEVQSLFVLPLFREIMVADKGMATATQKRGRAESIRWFAAAAGISLLAVIAALWLGFSLLRSQTLLAQAEKALRAPVSGEAGLLDQYNQLGVLGATMAQLERYHDHGAPFTIAPFMYQGNSVLAALKPAYVARLQQLCIYPAVKYFEYRIDEAMQAYGELSGEQYNSLYNALKAYLSISEAAGTHRKELDTAFVHEALFEAVKQSLLSTTGSARLPQRLEVILAQNLGLYALFLKRGEAPLVQENQQMVATARQRLAVLPSAATLYQTVIARQLDKAPRLSLDQLINRREAGLLKTDATISFLYTQKGFDQIVADALNQASKDPYAIDWVLGLSREQMPQINSGHLHDAMLEAYCADFKAQWCGFLKSIACEQFGDVGRSARMLQKLGSDQSEIKQLLEAIGTATQLKSQNLAEAAAGKALEATSKIKGAKSVADSAGGFSLPFAGHTPFDDVNATFDALRNFTKAGGGTLGGYEGYRDKLLTLAGKLDGVSASGEDALVTIINGSEADPLFGGWKYVESSMAGMPEGLGQPLQQALLLPFVQTGGALSGTLTRTLNARWQAQIVRPFTNRLAGRYPFSSKGEDAAYSDVMDFFRPTTGAFWGFYERSLAPFIVKNSSGWMVRSGGPLSFNFNPSLAKSLSAAERLRDMFFKPDGTARVFTLAITPLPVNKNNAQLIVNGQTFDFSPGGKSAQFDWPQESDSKGAALKIAISNDFSQDIAFSGQWGLLKLLQAATIEKINGSTFSVLWQVNVQNTYIVAQKYRITVASSDHPFGEPVFSGFDCPLDLLLVANRDSTQQPK